MGENAATHPEPETPVGPATYDVFLAYTDADEDIAAALQQELHRQRPGLRIWREKRRIGVGDAFNQASDMAIAACSVVLAVWTKHAARSGAFTLEARRAMTLRKPFVNLLADVPIDALAPPYSKYSAFQIDEVVALSGRSGGWLPPHRPSRDDLDDELKPVIDRIALHMRQSGDTASEIAEGLIQGVLSSAGAAHTAQFETMVKSIAPGDPATAVEVLALNEYTEAEINTLLTPQSVRLANRTEDAEPTPWGGWYVRPFTRKITPAQKENGLAYALAGFLAAGLGALALWVMGSTLSSGPGREPIASTQAEPSLIEARADVAGSAAALPPARNADAQPNCALNSDGSISGAPCTLTTNVAPLIGPDAPDGQVAPVELPPTLEACIVSLGGGIENAPCRLNARYVPPSLTPPQASRLPCVPDADGTIRNTPCLLEGNLDPPPAERVEIEVPADLPEPCAIADGAVVEAPCLMASAVAEALAGQAERAAEAADTRAQEASAEACTVENGAVTNAPCLLIAEVGARLAGEGAASAADAAPTCRGLFAGSEIEEGCRLDEDVRLAYLPCNADLSNYPCTLSEAPRRFAASGDPAPTSRPRGEADVGPGILALAPAPDPIDMPANLQPCEDAIVAPCQFTVSNAGLDTLTQIAQSFYGKSEAWCRIYRANAATFGTRNRPRRSADPNCIFMSDVLDLPPPTANDRYSLAGCPPAQRVNACGPPAR
ncbi:MAG: toll/interleukin-1 receptor domain-containing protein [Pseudomonadota bacterium]